MLQMSLGSDEVVLSVFAPPETIAGIAYQGLVPVFADVDVDSLSLSRLTVEDQVTVHTKGVLVTPLAGVVGDWESLRAVTEPRSLQLAVEGQGRPAKWEWIAPGVKGLGDHLIQVDPQEIHGGAAEFARLLADRGLETAPLPAWPGRRKDYPGACRAEATVLQIPHWREHREQLAKLARNTARQMSLAFDALPKRSASETAPAAEALSAKPLAI
jgi:hypothetical protein